ncbi:MAG: arylsulfatase [Phycisphaerales bacterium]|nr:arylsulfatase [Phycisphaerales bacterium]
MLVRTILAQLLIGLSATACASNATRANDELPNLVIIFCDDLGWGDLPGFALDGVAAPAYTREMPNIARLEREGARFTNFYTAQPVCSASRAALLTGCYPNRIGIHGALFPDAKHGIQSGEITLAEMLRSKGYATGIFGKWHLGHLPQFNPTLHGFDEYFGIPYSNDMWKPRFKGHPPLPVYNDAIVVETMDDLQEQGELTRRLTERACAFIKREAAENQPFFAYLPHPQPHTPLAVSAAFSPVARDGMYASVMREIDWSVGEVLRVLDESGVAENTIVLFTGDNGPWLAFGADAGSAGGLREGKGTTFEGGVREPCVLRWPKHVPAGATSCVPWMTIDLFATIAKIVDAAPVDSARPIDGKDARAIWCCEENARASQEAFFFYYHTNALEAVRMGKWKLCLPHASRTVAPRAGLQPWEEAQYRMEDIPLSLFDLERDPGEQHSVLLEHPDVVESIMREVERARGELGDSLTKRRGRGSRERSEDGVQVRETGEIREHAARGAVD